MSQLGHHQAKQSHLVSLNETTVGSVANNEHVLSFSAFSQKTESTAKIWVGSVNIQWTIQSPRPGQTGSQLGLPSKTISQEAEEGHVMRDRERLVESFTDGICCEDGRRQKNGSREVKGKSSARRSGVNKKVIRETEETRDTMHTYTGTHQLGEPNHLNWVQIKNRSSVWQPSNCHAGSVKTGWLSSFSD